MKSLDVALTLGGGIHLPVSSVDLAAEGQYQYGTVDITDGFDAKNRTLTFSLRIARKRK